MSMARLFRQMQGGQPSSQHEPPERDARGRGRVGANGDIYQGYPFGAYPIRRRKPSAPCCTAYHDPGTAHMGLMQRNLQSLNRIMYNI